MKLNKKVTIFGKQISVIAIALLAMAGLASAGLLSYYGMLEGTAVVHQSVKVDGKNWNEPIIYTIGSSSIVAGSSDVEGPHNLKNFAEVPATVKLDTNQQPEDSGPPGRVNGITTTYHGVLELTTKTVVYGTSPWVITGDKKATIWYTLTGGTFNWSYVDYKGIIPTEYTLIYYKDNSNRFSSPAAAIPITTSIESLPYSTDANVGEYNYCGTTVNITEGKTGDNYAHCHGAKLWLVPTTCLTGNTISWDIGSCASKYLFETDLISYTKTSDGKINLPANGGGVNFVIVNDFALKLVPYTYTITTTVVPA